jgi:hypothetical protein
MKSSRATASRENTDHGWLNVSVAGWVLSLFTLLLGTVLPTLYARFAFDGISIGKVDVAQYKADASEAGMSFSVRIANTTKSAIAVEAIKTNLPELLHGLNPHLTSEEAWIESPSAGEEGENLPIVIPPESVRSIEFKEYYRIEPPTDSSIPHDTKAAEIERIKSSLRRAIVENGLEVAIILNGKLRPLSIRTSAENVRESIPPPPPPPPPISNRQPVSPSNL